MSEHRTTATLERGLVRTWKETRERGVLNRWRGQVGSSLSLSFLCRISSALSAECASGGGGCVYEQGPPGDIEVRGQRAGHSLPGEGTWREDSTPGGMAKGTEAASFDGRGSGYEGEAQEW